jgi:predicted KAP-like P-loop ATPase
MWHDNETTVDYVNFRLVAKSCAELIRDTEGEPISIGISGGWGAGKSSLVRMAVKLAAAWRVSKDDASIALKSNGLRLIELLKTSVPL